MRLTPAAISFFGDRLPFLEGATEIPQVRKLTDASNIFISGSHNAKGAINLLSLGRSRETRGILFKTWRKNNLTVWKEVYVDMGDGGDIGALWF